MNLTKDYFAGVSIGKVDESGAEQFVCGWYNRPNESIRGTSRFDDF